MLVFFIPLILIFVAPVMQVILCSLRIKGKLTNSIGVITAQMMLLGIALPVLATYISMASLPPDIKCATGCITFVVIGLFMTMVFIPIAGVVSYWAYQSKHKKDLV